MPFGVQEQEISCLKGGLRSPFSYEDLFCPHKYLLVLRGDCCVPVSRVGHSSADLPVSPVPFISVCKPRIVPSAIQT